MFPGFPARISDMRNRFSALSVRPQSNLSGQSQRTQTIKWTNQNWKKLHVADVKRGKTFVSKSRLVSVLLLIGWMTKWREFFNQSRTRPLHPFHALGNCIEFYFVKFVTVSVISPALVPLGNFETATKKESDSQSHCSAEGKCSPDEKGEFRCGMC